MSVHEIIEQIKRLPPAERAQVTKFVLERFNKSCSHF